MHTKMGLKKTKVLKYANIDIDATSYPSNISRMRQWCKKTFGECHYLGSDEKVLPYVWYQIYVQQNTVARFYFANPEHAAWFSLKWT